MCPGDDESKKDQKNKKKGKKDDDLSSEGKIHTILEFSTGLKIKGSNWVLRVWPMAPVGPSRPSYNYHTLKAKKPEKVSKCPQSHASNKPSTE